MHKERHGNALRDVRQLPSHSNFRSRFGPIPFAIGGGLIALYLADLDFSVSAAIGVPFAVRRRRDGWQSQHHLFPRIESSGYGCRGGGLSRCRAAHATDAHDGAVGGRRAVSGAISHGIGSLVQRPLATVVVGGMFIGPLLLLVIAPALRRIFLGRDQMGSGSAAEAPASGEGATAEGAE